MMDLGSIPSISKDYRGPLRWSLEMRSSWSYNLIMVLAHSIASPSNSVECISVREGFSSRAKVCDRSKVNITVMR